MFNNKKYISKGVNAMLSLPLQNLLWYLVETMQVEQRDYLQVFTLYEENGVQMLCHAQENPSYTKTEKLEGFSPITAKVFVIDDGTHSTMILAEEY